ncbi:hypothetical protein OB905_06790 [Halobacteria archaeon AArc-dxtr1]|nr:hypothetical protein [Halobacteria archaeon AArc-dxtr1]
MGDKKFTFVELHLDGNTQFGPKEISDALPGGRKVEVGAESDVDEEVDSEHAEDDSAGKGVVGALVGLVLLVGIAVAIKKFRGGDEEEPADAEQPDVIVN